MAEQNIPQEDPKPNLQINTSTGLVNPASLGVTDINVPDPPQSYPLGVMSTSMIPTQKQVGISASQQGAQRLAELSRTAGSWANNPTHYSKIRAYNADFDGANYKRYAALPLVYKKMGFTPFRDNESLYNKESNWVERYGRSIYASANLASSAFADMLPWNTWKDWNDPNVTSAKEMARWHAVGHDSKGGLGSWINNMTVDFGYTGGILAEMAAEELVMWGGAALTAGPSGGTSLAAAGTNLARNVKRAFNLTNRFKDVYKGISTTYDWLKGADKAQDFWRFAKTYGGKGLQGITEAVIPETFKVTAEMAKNPRAMEKALSWAGASKTFGAFYRDVRAYTAVVSEAKLEGGSTELEVRNSLMDEYYRKNGRTASGEDLRRIYEEAANAGRQTFYWNLPALWISNKIVFDKALRGWKPLSAFREELESGIKGKLVFRENWKQANKKAWEAVETGMKGRFKTLMDPDTYTPKNLFRNSLGSFVNYTKANLTEGLQEVYQDVVSDTMIDYYKDRFNNFYTTGSRSVFGAFYDHMTNIDPAKTGQAFASGYFMGAMAKFPQKLMFDIVPEQFHKWSKPEEYEQWRNTREKNTKSIVDALNAVAENNGFWDAITENTVTQITNQREADLANEANDKRTYYDIIDDSVFEHLHTLLRFGKLDLIKDQLKDMKSLDAKGLQEAFGPLEGTEQETQSEYQKRIDSMLRKADMVEKMYTEVEKRYSNPFDPAKYDKKTQTELYNKEYEGYVSWEEAKKTAVKSSFNFYRTTDRMKSVMDQLIATKPVAESAASEFMLALNSRELLKEILTLKGKDGAKGLVQLYKEGDEESQAEAARLEKRLELLENYSNAVSEYEKAVEIHNAKQSRVITPEQEAEERGAKIKEGTKVKNKKGREAVVSKIKSGKAYDANGGLIGKVSNLEILEGAREEDILQSASNNLYEAYRSWIKYISKAAGEPTLDSAIADSFLKLRDYHGLKVDKMTYAEAIDVLHNPARFTEYANRISKVAGVLRERHKAHIQESYEKFEKSMHLNQLFRLLYENGFFVDEEGMRDILDGKVPDAFYYIAGEKDQVPYDSEDYKKILDIIEKYEKVQNVSLGDKPIPERELTIEDIAFAADTRNKIRGDKRALRDLAQQYGFSEDPNQESKINTREVLQKIIKSEYATYREKALARRLLGIVSKDSVITFKKLSRPGEFRYSSEAKIGTFVDPRYTADEYRGADLPLETLILHELMHEITSFELSKNPQFKAAIKKLMNAAEAAYTKRRPTDQMIYGRAVSQPFYGLKNEQEFLAEMFTNPRFAAWLDTVDYEVTGKSVWKEFLDMLQQMLSQLLGVTRDNTLLKEAMNIATSYIEAIHGKTTVEPAPASQKIRPGRRQAAPSGPALTPASTIEQYRAAGVLPALISAYRTFVNTRTGEDSLTAEEWPDPNVASKTDEQVAESEEFRTYLQLGSTEVQKILAEYNRTKSAPQPAAQPATTAGVPLTITSQIRQQLYDLGYNKQDVDRMRPEEAQTIIGNQTTKPAPARPATPRAAASGIVEITPEKEKEILDAITEEDYIAYSEGITEEAKAKARTSERQQAIADARAAAKKALAFISGKVDARNYVDQLGYNLPSMTDSEVRDTAEREAAYWRTKVGEPVKPAITPEEALDGLAAAIDLDQSSPTQAQKKIIAEDMGYGWGRAMNMTKSEAEYIIDNNLTASLVKEIQDRRAEEEKKRQEEESEMLRQATLQDLIRNINEAETKSELDATENAILTAISEKDLVVEDIDMLDALIKQRKEQLAREINYDDIEENSSLIMKNGSRVVVVKKENNTLYLRPFGRPGARAFRVKASEVKNKILYKDQPYVEQLTIFPPADPETQQTAAQVVNDAVELNDTDTIKEDIEIAKNTSAVAIEDDFDNSLGCE